MRKVSVEIIPSEKIVKAYAPYLKYLDSISMTNLLKIDFLKNVELLILEIVVKPDYDFHKIKWPESVVFYNVLKESGNKITLLTKIKNRDLIGGIMKVYDLDVIWDAPYVTERDRIVRSCIADEKNLKKFVSEMQKYGEISNISYKKSNYKETNLLSLLTRKQREILKFAQREGYYKLPRKINGDGLAKLLKISKATVLEHLRRIENKIMNNIMD